MLEKQFADFLTTQMHAKVELLSREVDHPAVIELQAYIDQLDTMFKAILSTEETAPRTRTKRRTTEQNSPT
ncbi:hypothetical protein [Alicyclobacillus dauci]|uniref:Uncharacterized protein n=1 Tax=Alicyclobacillus dauci TaxID=1475485 RepID=A0ABY6YWY9_9BACL|nr:hypothetical protein [Alicyclobacillus dauci]WAH35078.1 hypothetical protein NZD86_12140 [Alicyclobacillus dauci]